MSDPFVCEYCNEELIITEDPFYDREHNLIQIAYCEQCDKIYKFLFTLSDIEEEEIDEDF